MTKRKMAADWCAWVPEYHHNFSFAEFQVSETAARRGFDNTVPLYLMGNATQTLRVLQGVRNCLNNDIQPENVTNYPLIITSGYRSPEVNLLVGGAINSDHTRAQAADFIMPKIGTPLELCKRLMLDMDRLGIWQLIHEFGRWVHISTATTATPGNRLLTIDSQGLRRGIHHARG